MNTTNNTSKSVNDIMNQAARLQAASNAAHLYSRTDAIRRIAFRYFDNIRACAGSFNSNDDAEYSKQYTRAQYMNGTNAIAVTITKTEDGYTATAAGVKIGWICSWFNNTHAAVMSFGIRTRRELAMPQLNNAQESAQGFIDEANAVLWLGDMIKEYFTGHGIAATIATE